MNNPDEKAFFIEIMGSKNFKTQLLYRRPKDGANDFNRKNVAKKIELTLFKVKYIGICIGEITSAEW